MTYEELKSIILAHPTGSLQRNTQLETHLGLLAQAFQGLAHYGHKLTFGLEPDPEPIEYPKAMYDGKGGVAIVHSAEEEHALLVLDAGWYPDNGGAPAQAPTTEPMSEPMLAPIPTPTPVPDGPDLTPLTTQSEGSI